MNGIEVTLQRADAQHWRVKWHCLTLTCYALGQSWVKSQESWTLKMDVLD